MRVKGVVAMSAVVLLGMAGCLLPPVLDPVLLYSEDFTNAQSPDWWQGTASYGGWEIRAGRYWGLLYNEDSYMYEYPSNLSNLSDCRVEVTTGVFGSATDHSWGLILRASEERFYAFEISRNGYVLISVCTPSDWDDLYGWEPTSAIHQDGQTNRLRVDAQDDHFTFYVNGQRIAEVVDATLSAGSVGFVVETWDDASGGAWFDDLEVWSIEE